MKFAVLEYELLASALDEAASNARREFQAMQAMAEHVVSTKLKARIRVKSLDAYERFSALLDLEARISSSAYEDMSDGVA